MHSAKTFSVGGRQVTQSIVRGVLGGILGGGSKRKSSWF